VVAVAQVAEWLRLAVAAVAPAAVALREVELPAALRCQKCSAFRLDQ
jgi:hypothetical protein